MISLFDPVLLAQAATTPPLGAAGATAGAASASRAVGASPTATLNPQLLQQLQSGQLVHHTTLQANAPWLTHLLGGLFLVSAVSLILLLAVQTTKQEGLSGTIGGRVESAYRPRLGFDQQLARLTSFVAISMVFFGLIVSITGI